MIAALPPQYAERLAQTPIIVLDRPDAAMLAELGIDPDDEEAVLELCGLHTGVAMTDVSVEDSGELPSEIHIFREGVIAFAGGSDGRRSDTGRTPATEEDGVEKESGDRGEKERVKWVGEKGIAEQIRITILHELGHQFGLDEDDLFELGYE